MVWMCKCGSDRIIVTDSRKRDTGYIYRRKVCKDCGRKWTTYEVLEEQVKEGVINGLRYGLL